MPEHAVATQEEWQVERDKLLAEEKELTRRSDELARKRRELPWLPVEEELKPFLEGEIPPTVEQNAELCGTDPAGYVAEDPGMSAYTLSDGVVYRTYVTTARGLEPTMGYYFLLDRTPPGRDEDDSRP